MRDALICGYVRTPIGRYGGALASVRPDDLAALTLRTLIERHGLGGAAVDEVVLGCANQAGEDNRNVARMASLLAGLPDTVPAITLNRLCGSGLDAVADAARKVRTGEADLILAGGVESMTRAPLVIAKAETAWTRSADIHDTTIGWRFVNPALADAYGTASMPETAETVAARCDVSREDQDAFAARSQALAEAAQVSGRLAREIVAVPVQARSETVLVDKDEHPRPGTTPAKLAKLPTPFREGGTVTAGNASGVNDGAAALIVASTEAAEHFGLTPLASIAGYASAGVHPDVMGLGPVPAIRKLMERIGLDLDVLGVIEINEAFAAQALAVLRVFGITGDDPRVNLNGGAIALGHPLGASGARLAGTAAMEVAARGTPGLASMCVGVGQGVAMGLVPPVRPGRTTY